MKFNKVKSLFVLKKSRVLNIFHEFFLDRHERACFNITSCFKTKSIKFILQKKFDLIILGQFFKNKIWRQFSLINIKDNYPRDNVEENNFNFYMSSMIQSYFHISEVDSP